MLFLKISCLQRSTESHFLNMKSCYKALHLRRNTVFYQIFYVSKKKIKTGNFKIIIRPKEPAYISFSALKVGRKPLIFQLKDLKNIRPEEVATFLLLF